MPSQSLAPRSQAVEILQRAAMNFRAEFLERPDVPFGAREADDLMPAGDQFFCGFGPDESGGAGNEYAHEKHSLFRAPEYGYYLFG